MIACPSCGAENAEGTRFCVKCGTTLSTAPSPESWRAPSGDLNQAAVADQPSGGYTPQTPPSAYPTYTPPGVPQTGQPLIGGSQPMHPAIPAIVSLLFPGLGLLFVPNKAGLGIGIFAGWVVMWGITFVLSFIAIGLCLIPFMFLANVAAAVHSWDEAAKVSGGQFQPILFK